MRDYLLLIKTRGSVWTDLSTEELQKHLKNGSAYIKQLNETGKLKHASPIENTGSTIITKKNGDLKIKNVIKENLVVAVFFYICTKDLEEAIEIASSNPIFEDISTTIEIYPLMSSNGL